MIMLEGSSCASVFIVIYSFKDNPNKFSSRKSSLRKSCKQLEGSKIVLNYISNNITYSPLYKADWLLIIIKTSNVKNWKYTEIYQLSK